jgi:photosystem II stability/assembly factor-like uncharacterized protein
MGPKALAVPLVCLVLAHCAVFPRDASAQARIDSATFGAVEARALGPARMSGRISALDGVARDPDTVYVGTASGGVWKTTNGGTTFKPIFDKHTQSIGAVAVDQANPSVVWVGTGESWVRNSVSVGTGVYKSTDAGENWQLVGLADSERIGKIAIDPKNSDVVYVAALGHLWNANEERGLYKTTDGGKTWSRVLYVDASTGCSDVALDPQEPNVVYAATWQFRRQGWSFSSGGPGSGLHKSTDGGKTWQRVTKGMPEGTLGRIAVAVAPARASVVYATVEAKKTALYRSDDQGVSWTELSSAPDVTARPFYFSTLTVDPKDYNRVYKPGFGLSISKDGGKTFSPSPGSFHGDVHAVWVSPADPSEVYIGTDGGVYRSTDSGNRFDMLRNLPVSQFYHVSFDMQQPYHVYGGLQDNGSWAGPSRAFNGVRNSDWQNVGIGDGFYTFADPTDRNWVYAEYQGGRLSRYNRLTGERQSIAPFPKAGEAKYRFNWNTPVEISPTNPTVLYIGAQFLFRSKDRGMSWERISGDLTTNDPVKQKQEDSGGLTTDNSSAENHCTIFTIAESPRDPNVVWVGTDDGNVQVTQDGGRTWSNVTANLPGLPKSTWCSTVEASNFDRATAYATFDGHTTGDMKPYVYKTTDFGKTWTPLATDAIQGFAHVVREDLVRPDLLFVGTEFGLFLSLDGGKQWARFTGKLPPVSVRDIAIHPRESDVVVATHGRGIYVLDDITPLRNLTPAVLEADVAFLESKPSEVRFGAQVQDFPGDDEFVGPNRPDVAFITYYLKDRHVKGDFVVQILDQQGKLITTLPAGKRRGINRVEWPMRLKAPKVPAGAQVEFGSLFGPVVPEGAYVVKLVKDGKEHVGKVTLVGDPTLPHSAKDRALQQQTVMKLYGMLERLAYVAEAVRDLREQAAARRAMAKDDAALAADLAALEARLDAFYATLAATREGRITGEEQLREKLGELYGGISGYAGRPTQSQLDRLVVLDGEVAQADRTFEALAGAEVARLGQRLAAKGLQPLMPLTREEFDRRTAR